MIIIDGTQYKQATDAAVVAYDGGKHVLTANGDVIERVKVSDFAQGGTTSHNHNGEGLKPAWLQPDAGHLVLSAVSGLGSTINLYDFGFILVQSGNLQGITLSSDWAITLLCRQQIYNGVMLDGTAGFRTILADAFNIYPCRERDKSNISIIPSALQKVKRVKGITFTQDGVDRSGVSAEDLDSLGLPDAVYRRGGKIESINPMALLPVLVESIKELSARVDLLEGR